MGKGKSIYSGSVLGNRRGREWRKKGLRERFHQCTRQTNKTKNTKWSKKWSFKACRLIPKKNSISILSTEGRVFKKHS